MKKYIFYFLIALGALSLGSCRKDSVDVTTTTQYPEGPAVYVKTSIGGFIVDESGGKVPDATVTLGKVSTKTDKNGVFNFQNVVVNAKGAYIQVEHPAYFHGSRTVIVGANTRNTVKIQLLSNAVTRFVDAGSGGAADYGDYSITLPADGIAAAGGVVYSGQVGVAAKWLDPTSTDFVEQMPGRFEGITTDNQRSGMVSMGMLAVELKDAAGNKLNIRDGFEATLRMKVASTLLAKAPATIPLWYFDEAAGVWVEEGQATLNNGFYEGKVKHFSFWNHDYKDPLVEIKFKVVDQNGNPLENAKVYTQLVVGGLYGYGYTDNMGCVYGLVPKDELLNASVYPPNPNCSSPVLMQQIGPFAQNGDFTFTVNLTPLSNYTISGDLVDCGGAPVTNGYVLVDGVNDIFWADNAGHFEIALVSCTPLTAATLTGYDLANLKTSAPQVANFNGGSTVNLGTVSTCNALQYYLTYTFGGNTFTDVHPNFFGIDSIQGGPVDFLLIRTNDPSDLYVYITLEDVGGTGTFTPLYCSVEGKLNGNTISHSCGSSSGSCSGMTVTITEYNGPGGIVAGTYSGTLSDVGSGSQPPPLVSVSGTFRAILK